MAKATAVDRTEVERMSIAHPLKDEDLRAILGISVSLFYKNKGEGKYDGLMCLPRITGNTRYSATLVQRWAEGLAK